jgi:hypothetical protein
VEALGGICRHESLEVMLNLLGRHGLSKGLQMVLPGGMWPLLMAIFNIHLWAKHIHEDIL